jgi:hypothetical protein
MYAHYRPSVNYGSFEFVLKIGVRTHILEPSVTFQGERTTTPKYQNIVTITLLVGITLRSATNLTLDPTFAL